MRRAPQGSIVLAVGVAAVATVAAVAVRTARLDESREFLRLRSSTPPRSTLRRGSWRSGVTGLSRRVRGHARGADRARGDRLGPVGRRQPRWLDRSLVPAAPAGEGQGPRAESPGPEGRSRRVRDRVGPVHGAPGRRGASRSRFLPRDRGGPRRHGLPGASASCDEFRDPHNHLDSRVKRQHPPRARNSRRGVPEIRGGSPLSFRSGGIPCRSSRRSRRGRRRRRWPSRSRRRRGPRA